MMNKAYTFKGSIADGVLAGSAAVMGNVDRDGDVIHVWAFDGVLDRFLKDGFVADTHSWTLADTVAYPVLAEPRGNSLYVEARFHSDERSQALRTKLQERLEAGLSVGLSIAFAADPEHVRTYSSGAELADELRGGEYADLYELDAIAQAGKVTAIGKVRELFEFSIVPVPANPRATATTVKSMSTIRDFERFLRDAGFSRSDAVAIASHGWKAARRDTEEARVDVLRAKLALLKLRRQ